MSDVIGQTLTRKKKAHVGFDSIRVIGKQGNAFVIASAEEHRPPIQISGPTLAVEYGAKVDDEETDGERMRRQDAEATMQAAREYSKYSKDTARTPDPASPEGIFAQAAQAAAEAHED